MVSILPLSILEAIIVLWVLSALWRTIRALRIRNNIPKLRLYQHFTTILIFAIIGTLLPSPIIVLARSCSAQL